jgi:hypothetical protein
MQEIFLSQLADPFRWALIAGLVFTMIRTEAVTGRFIPLAAGIAFVAAIIPLTMGARGATVGQAIGVGVASNLVILAVVLGLWTLVQRLRR